MIKIDWNEMWRSTEDSIERSNNLDFWNDFAPRFGRKNAETDPYIELFYEYMEADPKDTLFDMGCGPGTLAIPFAKKGHEVFAADFSPEMLKQLMIRAEDAGVAERISRMFSSIADRSTVLLLRTVILFRSFPVFPFHGGESGRSAD